MLYLFLLILVLLVIGCVVFFSALKQKEQLGSLAQETVYQDTQLTPGEVMFAKTFPLMGKPDYLIRQGNFIIPVEVKTGKTPTQPYPNHRMQLVAYCLLVEENFGVAPQVGFLKYPEKEFAIPYTPEAKAQVQRLITEIFHAKKTNLELHCRHREHYQ